MENQIVTEKTMILPHGRGRVVVISEKRVLPKPKKGKRAQSITLFAIKSNPNPIVLKMFMNNGIKRVVIFPEGRILQYEERLALVSALLPTLKQNLHTKHRKSHTISLTVSEKRERVRGIFSKELKSMCIKNYDKINRFVRRCENES